VRGRDRIERSAFRLTLLELALPLGRILCAATGSEDFLSGLPLRVQLPITGGNLVGGVQDGMVKNGLDIWFG